MKYFLIIVAALCVITLVNILLESHRENKKISFSSYRIKDKRLKKNAKIVMISDLHNACYGEKNSELLHVVETISPDLILVAGDVIVGKTGLSVDTGVDFLNSLGGASPCLWARETMKCAHQYMRNTEICGRLCMKEQRIKSTGL